MPLPPPCGASTAIVTTASSGPGDQFARRLAGAERGRRVVIPGGPAVRAAFAPDRSNRCAPIPLALALAKRALAKRVLAVD